MANFQTLSILKEEEVDMAQGVAGGVVVGAEVVEGIVGERNDVFSFPFISCMIIILQIDYKLFYY